jgi:uncharacterized protein YbjT (DUF2867 family)
VRDLERGKAIADAGVEIAVGNLDIPESIDQAMAGVTSVVLVSSAVPAQELNVIASAARAGTEHVAKATSNASADSPILFGDTESWRGESLCQLRANPLQPARVGRFWSPGL